MTSPLDSNADMSELNEVKSTNESIVSVTVDDNHLNQDFERHFIFDTTDDDDEEVGSMNSSKSKEEEEEEETNEEIREISEDSLDDFFQAYLAEELGKEAEQNANEQHSELDDDGDSASEDLHNRASSPLDLSVPTLNLRINTMPEMEETVSHPPASFDIESLYGVGSREMFSKAEAAINRRRNDEERNDINECRSPHSLTREIDEESIQENNDYDDDDKIDSHEHLENESNARTNFTDTLISPKAPLSSPLLSLSSPISPSVASVEQLPSPTPSRSLSPSLLSIQTQTSQSTTKTTLSSNFQSIRSPRLLARLKKREMMFKRFEQQLTKVKSIQSEFNANLSPISSSNTTPSPPTMTLGRDDSTMIAVKPDDEVSTSTEATEIMTMDSSSTKNLHLGNSSSSLSTTTQSMRVTILPSVGEGS